MLRKHGCGAGKQLQAGDGASISNEGLLKFSPQEETELLLFDLA
ncbi:MAG: hypothetical protein ACJ8FY_29200 [Gemmataceae bacterium]